MPASRSEHLSPMHNISRILCVMDRTVFESRHGKLVSDLIDGADLGFARCFCPHRHAVKYLGRRDRAPPTGLLLLEGGELVLTTGLVMADAGGGQLAEYVASLAEAGVAARTGDRIASTPCSRTCAGGPAGRASQSIEVLGGPLLAPSAARSGPFPGSPSLRSVPRGRETETLVLQQLTRAAAKDKSERDHARPGLDLRGEVSSVGCHGTHRGRSLRRRRWES